MSFIEFLENITFSTKCIDFDQGGRLCSVTAMASSSAETCYVDRVGVLLAWHAPLII